MVDRLQALERTLRCPDAIIFVGSGVSCWSGLPTWTGLLERLAEYLAENGLSTDLVRREIECGDLLQAASYGFYQLSSPERAAFLKNTLQVGAHTPSELHSIITRLGPTSFITTNYDKLLERALSMWCPERHTQVVGNWDSVEVANVIQASSKNFLFKPHGDIDSADSIILTREDYRSFHGGKKFVFESLKTLLATRPIIFLGFGLRDLDFLLIKDILAETYPGGIQDHYAIVADSKPEEIPYWRQHYGIHLVSYATLPDEMNPHSQLLDLLSKLVNPAPQGVAVFESKAELDASDNILEQPDQILRLIRHCARMQIIKPRPNDDELPISIRPLDARPLDRKRDYSWLMGSSAIDALSKVNRHVLLTASPGAGKSFVLKMVTASLASAAQHELLEDGIAYRISNLCRA